MPAKIFVFERIKKLMGWCPNAKAHETRQMLTLKILIPMFQTEQRDDNIDLKNPWMAPERK